MNNIEKLVKLIRENPGTEVMPLVEMEVVGDGDYARYGGFIGESTLDEYYCENERIYFTEDYDELLEEISERIWLDHQEENRAITEEAADKLADKEMARLEWKKVIVVNIDSI